jgi:hypothetical protein
MGEFFDSSEIVETAEALASVSGDPARQLTPPQRAFAAHYVATGNATRAAELAGYSNPNSQGHRLVTNRRIGALIKRLAIGHLDSGVAVALAELARQVTDATVSNADRRKAAESLLDRAGVRRGDGPSVAVQVNVGSDAPARALIKQVWDSRQARLSGIAAPMPDAPPTSTDLDDGTG